MKVLLTAVNAKYIHSNLAVYSLRAFAQDYETETEIAEYTINQTVDEILMDLVRRKPDVICFSCYIWNIRHVQDLAVELCKVLPGVRIWLGGPEVSYNPVEVLEKLPSVSGVMCQEGEQTFLELMQYFTKGDKTLDEIDGIVFREGAQVRQNPLRPVMDLNQVPFVYEQIENFENKIIYYESSRGCPFSCSYCLSSIDKCLRFRDMDLVREELQFFIDREVPQVKFVDRTFNCSHTHAMEIWNYIAQHDRGKTNFHFEVSADLLNEEELALIESLRPGLIQLEIGIQSTNPETLREIRRTMNLERLYRNVKRIQAGGNVHQHLDLIAGLPQEDYKSFSQSFRDVYALHPEQLQLGFLKVLKGSYMHEKAEDYGLVYQQRPPFEVLATRWLSYEEIIRLKSVEEMVEVYYNSGQFVHTLRLLEEKFQDTFALYEALGQYYEERNLYRISHSRTARYEILYDFIREYDGDRAEVYRQMLILDLYLREHVKKRPDFAGEAQISKEEAAQFYDREAKEYNYLKGYEGYEKRQLRKMTHLEWISGQLLLFDYRNRNVLTNQAQVYVVKEKGDCL